MIAAAFLALVFGFAGVLMIRAGRNGFAENRRALAGSIRTQGVVVLMRTEKSELSIYEYPVVRFTTAEGAAVEFEASIRVDPPRHKVGDRVEVYYPPLNPERADIVGTNESGYLVALLLGLAFLAAAAVALLTLTRCLLLGECPIQGA